MFIILLEAISITNNVNSYVLSMVYCIVIETYICTCIYLIFCSKIHKISIFITTYIHLPVPNKIKIF